MNLRYRVGLWILVLSWIVFGSWSESGLKTKTGTGNSQNEVIAPTITNQDLMSVFFQNTSDQDGFQKADSIVGVTGYGTLFSCIKHEIKTDLRLDDTTFIELWDTKQIYQAHLGHQSDTSLLQTVVYFPYNAEKHIGSTLLLFESKRYGEEIRLDDVILDLGLHESLTSISLLEERDDQLKVESTDGKHPIYTILKWDGNIFHMIVPPKDY